MADALQASSTNFEKQPPIAGAPTLRDQLPTLLVDAALPAISYQILSRHGVATVPALAIGAIFPAAHVLIGFVRKHTINLIGAIVLGFIVAGTIASLISGNVLFVLIKESFFTALFGVICLSSLLWTHPLMFYLGRQFAAGNDPARIAWWNGLWEREAFRTAMRLITTVWGVAYVAEAIARLIFALTLSPGMVVIVSPIMAIGITVLLIIWTQRYGRTVRERREREEAALRVSGS